MNIPSVFTLKSPAFKDQGEIPATYTCDGEDISPPLEWTNIPPDTKSFALISDDPDAPMGTWVHWVVFNLPPETVSLPQGIQHLPAGAMEGINDFRRIGYGGPCPPGGVHRYYFKLYALDTMLTLRSGAAKAELLKAMQGHVLAEATIMARYRRAGK